MSSFIFYSVQNPLSFSDSTGLAPKPKDWVNCGLAYWDASEYCTDLEAVRKQYDNYLDNCEAKWWHCKFGGQFYPGKGKTWKPEEIPTDEFCKTCPNYYTQTRLVCAANLDLNDKVSFPGTTLKCLKAVIKMAKNCPSIIW